MEVRVSGKFGGDDDRIPRGLSSPSDPSAFSAANRVVAGVVPVGVLCSKPFTFAAAAFGMTAAGELAGRVGLGVEVAAGFVALRFALVSFGLGITFAGELKSCVAVESARKCRSI